MTCCIGKARIYFREPINYWLTYQLPDGSFGSVTAQEPLTTTTQMQLNVQPGILYRVAWAITWYPIYQAIRYKSGIFYNQDDPLSIKWTVGWYWYDRDTQWVYFSSSSTPNLSAQHVTASGGFKSEPKVTLTVLSPSGQPLDMVCEFKVTGTETGTVYREIGGLEECPTVISNICLMGEERYVDQLLPDQTPGGPVESSCFVQTVDGNNLRVDLVTKYKGIDNKKLRPPQTRNVLYLTGLPGCLPEYRVECCGIDQCDPEEQCPPDTDCSLDCDGLVCCYKDGKVIKSFRK